MSKYFMGPISISTKVEVQDQIDVTKQLVSLYPFIDKSK